MIGETISHYKILAQIGRGGMGVVYLAEDTRLQRRVALKCLPADAMEERAKARFLHEAQTAARLSHPNICPIYEVDESDGRLFFVMSYLEGQPLSLKLQFGPLPVPLALDIGMQIANGLEAAHRQGVIHRDIKSGNIVVSEQNHASILDFGLALSGDTARLTVTGGIVGTPAYMSPEQATGAALDHRTDIWSLGVVLFEMLSAKRPFDRDRELSVVYGIVHDPAPSLLTLRADLSPDLAEVVNRALAKRPDERWQTARQFGDELRRIRDGRPAISHDSTTATVYTPVTGPLAPTDPTATMRTPPVAQPVPVSASAAPQQQQPDRRRMWWLGAGAAVLALATAAGLWYRQPAPLPEEKHLAVLPLEVIGTDDGSIRAVSDGLVETLTSTLSEAREFQKKLLIVPSSEIRSRKIASAAEARRVYGVNLVIAGSAVRSRDAVQFNVNLIDAATLRQLGARTFEFDARHPMDVRQAALSRVLSLLNVQLSGAAIESQQTGGTSTPEAYGEFLKGRGFLVRYDVPGNLDRALDSLRKATELDANYAMAFAALGEAYWRKALTTSEKHWATRAIEAASQAVKLDPKLAMAHAKLGDIYAQSGRREEAITELEEALRLEPGSADAHRGLAGLYETMGRFKEAEQSYLRVTENRPTDWYAFLMLGVFYWNRHQYELTRKAFERAGQLTPDNDIVHRNLSALYLVMGKYAESRAAAQRALKLKPSARSYSNLGLAYFYDHRYQEAVSALEASVDLDSSYDIGWGNLGNAYRWAAGGEAKSRAAFRRAAELAQKRLDLTPDAYNVRANLAEYKAKLGKPEAALAELERIPSANRGPYWANLAQVYKLCGRRPEAIAIVVGAIGNAAQRHQLADDPDLADLMKEPAIQAALARRGP